MNRTLRSLVGVLAVVAVVFAFGCSGNKPAAPKKASGQQAPVVSEGEDHSHGTELSAEDKALADAQGVCPVSGEEFGGEMGPPVKEMVKGQVVFLCCKACLKKLHSDEDGYLAKVAELKKAKADDGKPDDSR